MSTSSTVKVEDNDEIEYKIEFVEPPPEDSKPPLVHWPPTHTTISDDVESLRRSGLQLDIDIDKADIQPCYVPMRRSSGRSGSPSGSNTEARAGTSKRYSDLPKETSSRGKRSRRKGTLGKSFKCDECNKTFSSSIRLKKHKKIHSKIQFKCSECQRSFSGNHNLMRHYKTNSCSELLNSLPKEARLECFACGNVPPNIGWLKWHLLCNACDSHQSGNTNKTFKCGSCPNQFASRQNLHQHSNLHTGKRPYSCSRCSKTFQSKANLRQHEATHDGAPKFKCSKCPKTFNQKRYLTSHNLQHANQKIVFACQQCSKKYTSKHNLQCHQRTHTGEMLECNECSRKFCRKLYRDQHLLVHTGERPFSCDLCNKKFLDKRQLTEHRRVCKGPTPFECTICSRKFRNEQQLADHVERHQYRGEKKRFECYVCKYNMNDFSAIRNHIRIHYGEKPFVCDETGCNKAFSWKISLNVHKQIHLKGKNFPCDRRGCGKHFKTKHYLLKHLRRMHADKTSHD